MYAIKERPIGRGRAVSLDPSPIEYARERFLERLQRVIDELANGRVSELARMTGIKDGTIRNYQNRPSLPTTDVLVQIAKGAGVRLEWLATGEGPMLRGKEHDDEILIPFFDVRAAAGDGLSAPDYESPLPPMIFKRAWLQALDISSTTHLQFLYAQGKSMEPTIRDGDFLMIDRDPDVVAALRDGIWVIREDNEVKVKRLQKASGSLRIISDDATWPPYSVPTAEIGTTLIVLGRVIWSGKRH
jgi:phage repressor protein C with HTH and peptisase S24 domain